MTLLLLSFFPIVALADWQDTLELNFDIVETFDQLDDWKGTGPTAAVDIQTYPSEFPDKTAGGASIWQYYSFYGNPADISANWIANHGPSFVWQGTGKSLIIDYNQAYTTDIKGPSRLGFKIGDSPDDGYASEVYVFYMIRVPKNFFKLTGDSFDYHNFVKNLDISAGFETVRVFGTADERAWMNNETNCPGSPPLTQVLNEYGLNAQVYNFYSYGTVPDRSEVMQATVLYTMDSGDVYPNCHYDGTTLEIFQNAPMGQSVLDEEWFGLQYRVLMSSPHGAANGEVEVWTYDDTGALVGHELLANQITFRDGSTVFNHGWNKFVLGGNRYDGIYCPGSIPGCDFGPDEHYYIDDFIVDSTPIASTYFTLLSQQAQAQTRSIGKLAPSRAFIK